MKRSFPPIIPHIGRANGTSGQPYWALLTVVLLVFVAGPRTSGKEIVPFKPEMEPLKRFAEDLVASAVKMVGYGKLREQGGLWIMPVVQVQEGNCTGTLSLTPLCMAERA